MGEDSLTHLPRGMTSSVIAFPTRPRYHKSSKSPAGKRHCETPPPGPWGRAGPEPGTPSLLSVFLERPTPFPPPRSKSKQSLLTRLDTNLDLTRLKCPPYMYLSNCAWHAEPRAAVLRGAWARNKTLDANLFPGPILADFQRPRFSLKRLELQKKTNKETSDRQPSLNPICVKSAQSPQAAPPYMPPAWF